MTNHCSLFQPPECYSNLPVQAIVRDTSEQLSQVVLLPSERSVPKYGVDWQSSLWPAYHQSASRSAAPGCRVQGLLDRVQLQHDPVSRHARHQPRHHPPPGNAIPGPRTSGSGPAGELNHWFIRPCKHNSFWRLFRTLSHTFQILKAKFEFNRKYIYIKMVPPLHIKILIEFFELTKKS